MGGVEVADVRVEFTYVEPGTTTAIKLGRLKANVHGLIVHVIAVADE